MGGAVQVAGYAQVWMQRLVTGNSRSTELQMNGSISRWNGDGTEKSCTVMGRRRCVARVTDGRW